MIPAPYLAQVMHSLGQSGIVKSQRGPQGGHSLARDPYEVTLSAVLVALGGMDTPVACLGDTAACAHVPSCAQREVWRDVDEAVYQILDKVTVGQLVDRTRAIRAEQRDLASGKSIKLTAV
jgi:Rrf2 family protein